MKLSLGFLHIFKCLNNNKTIFYSNNLGFFYFCNISMTFSRLKKRSHNVFPENPNQKFHSFVKCSSIISLYYSDAVRGFLPQGSCRHSMNEKWGVSNSWASSKLERKCFLITPHGVIILKRFNVLRQWYNGTCQLGLFSWTRVGSLVAPIYGSRIYYNIRN